MEVNKGGRPAKYESPDDLEKEIKLYFEGLKVFNKDGEFVCEKTPTTAGLAYHLGYADRQSLYYQKGRSEEFCCILKRAILYIESYHEGNLTDGKQPTGSIFWLKNHKWHDKQELEHSGGIADIDTSKLTDEQIEAISRIGHDD